MNRRNILQTLLWLDTTCWYLQNAPDLTVVFYELENNSVMIMIVTTMLEMASIAQYCIKMAFIPRACVSHKIWTPIKHLIQFHDIYLNLGKYAFTLELVASQEGTNLWLLMIWYYFQVPNVKEIFYTKLQIIGNHFNHFYSRLPDLGKFVSFSALVKSQQGTKFKVFNV